jgi:hypothetical protein
LLIANYKVYLESGIKKSVDLDGSALLPEACRIF